MIYSLKRGLSRILALIVIGIIAIAFAESFPQVLGEIGAPLVRGFGLVFIGMAVSDVALRILQPHIDTNKCGIDALENKNTAAGLIYLGRSLLMLIVMFLIVTAARV